MKWLQCLWRGHRPMFVRNIYGDEILMANARSVWKCDHCGRYLWRKDLHLPDEGKGV